MKILNKRQILLLHAALLKTSGGSAGIRDEGLLESALGTPFQTFAGQDLYPTVLEKATRLGFGLIKDHPFVDGNKRIGTHAMLVFLALNNITLCYEDEELIAAILAVADGTLDADGLLHWVQDHVE
jgi:death-on-curing protein